MKLGRGLLLGREWHQNDNNAFNVWLNDNELAEDLISKDDRAALIGMAEHPEIAERVLATTQRRSWQLIWREEIAPEVEVWGVFVALRKPPRTFPPLARADARVDHEWPRDGHEWAPIARARRARNRLIRSTMCRCAIDKCADGKQRTAHQIANKVQYAVSFVEPILKSLGDAVRVDLPTPARPLT